MAQSWVPTGKSPVLKIATVLKMEIHITNEIACKITTYPLFRFNPKCKLHPMTDIQLRYEMIVSRNEEIH